MSIDRSKFKGSSLAKVAETDAAANQLVGKANRNWADTLKIEDGSNRFRVYPAHPEEGDEETVYAEPVSRVFLPVIVEEKDKDGNVIYERGNKPKLKETQKPIFNSKLHGGTEKDLVEEYANLARLAADTIKDDAEKQKFLAKINGAYNDNPAFRLPGLTFQQSWVMYADRLADSGSKILEFGRLEVKKSIKDKMNKVAALEDAQSPLGVDPYSDAEAGLPVIIVKNVQMKGGSKIKPQDIYEVALDKNFDRVTKRLTEYPLTDEQLEKLMTFPSLKSLFRNAFKKKDFMLQLEGLELFDNKYEIGIFNTDEFTQIAEEIAAYYPEDEEPAAEGSEQGGEDAHDEKEVEKDQFDLMSRLELKSFITKNRLGIAIKERMTDDDIRAAIRTVQEPIPHVPLPGEEGDTPPPVTKPVATKPVTPAPKPAAATTGGTSTADRLAALRKK